MLDTFRRRFFVTLLLIPGIDVVAEESVSSAPPPWFQKLDRDGNGTLSPAEANRFFDQMDSDQDGEVTVTEATAFMKARRQRAGRPGYATKAADFEAVEKTDNGLWVVSIGHSCVAPAIFPTVSISRAAGYENHLHLMQFGGAGHGAARAQWNRPENTQEAKPALALGKIDVMTFGHLVDAGGRTHGCDVEDYKRWIDFALDHNPDIRFYIQDLWPWLPTEGRSVSLEDFDLAQFESQMDHVTEVLSEVVHELNDEYPDRIHVLPVGPGVVELVRRLQTDRLPGVDALVVSPEEFADTKRIGLYRDMIHPSNVSATLEGYVYYACLYGHDPRECDAAAFDDPVLDELIRDVAWRAVTDHPLSGVTADQLRPATRRRPR